MTAHFVQDFDPSCQRCKHGKLRPAPKESLPHIFWDCPKIKDILSNLNHIISNGVLTNEELRKTLFLGSNIKQQIYIICFTTLYFIFTTRDGKVM